MPYKIISVLGDSFTQGAFDETGLGWFGRLSTMVAAHSAAHGATTFCANNMSMAGDRICDAYHRFAAEALTRDIDVLIIAVGTNDVVRRGGPDAPTDLSPALRGEYWNWLLDMAAKNIPTVLVLDLLPVIEESETDANGVYDFNKDIEAYNHQIEQICADKGVRFIRRAQNWADRNLSELYVDWSHPNGRGHQLIADEVFAELEKLKLI